MLVALGMCSAVQGVHRHEMLQPCCRVDALGLAAVAPSNQGPASYMQVQQQLYAHCTIDLQPSLLGACQP